MAKRPRAVITTPFPRLSTLARELGISARRYRELLAMVTEAPELQRERNAGKRTAMRRRETRRS